MIRRASPNTLHPMPAAPMAERSDRGNPCERIALIRRRTDGAAGSLNLGCAAGICLYKIARQRGGNA